MTFFRRNRTPRPRPLTVVCELVSEPKQAKLWPGDTMSFSDLNGAPLFSFKFDGDAIVFRPKCLFVTLTPREARDYAQHLEES